MVSNGTRKQRHAATNNETAFIRQEDAPILPPPITSAGPAGWLYENIFASMLDYSTLGAAVKSIFMAIFTAFVAYIFVGQVYGLLDFAIFSAVWQDPEEQKRQVCWTVEQGGKLPNGWHGACWPYIIAKTKFILYGAYPNESLWRVNSTYLLGAILLGWVMIDRLPYRKFVGAVLLTIYPIFATVMLTGGGFGLSQFSVGVNTILGLALISFGRAGKMGWITGPLLDLSKVAGVAGWFFIFFAAALVSVGVDFDLSKALFIFSFNYLEKINRVLYDRMYLIRTKGFKMADKLREGLQEIPQLEVTDQGRLKCGIVTFRHEAIDAATIKSELARRKINVSVSSGSGSRLSFMERGIESVVRASMHYYNSEEELEHFLSKIRQLVA